MMKWSALILAVALVGCGDSSANGPRCEDDACGGGGSPEAGGSGGAAGAGGAAGQGGATGEGGTGGLGEDQCWVDEDCEGVGVFCVPVDYVGVPQLPTDEPGACLLEKDYTATLFFPTVRLVNVLGVEDGEPQYEELTGSYHLAVMQQTRFDAELREIGSSLTTFPAVDNEPGGIHGMWAVPFGLRHNMSIQVDDETVTCDLVVDFAGFVSGGTLIEGSDREGTVLCDGEPLGRRMLATFVVADLFEEP